VTDTSVVLAAILHHDRGVVRQCRARIEEAPTPIAHVLAESYARITSMPGMHRLRPIVARQILGEMFPGAPTTLSAEGYLRVIDLLADLNILGGAIYDCLIAETAREWQATLVSLDRRAAKNYAAVGANFILL
jgi:predicted nucleic acid-binding protein